MPIALLLEVLESWPLGLRLRIEGEAEEFHVDLAEDCQITQAGRVLQPGDLTAGLRLSLAERRPRVLERIEVQ